MNAPVCVPMPATRAPRGFTVRCSCARYSTTPPSPTAEAAQVQWSVQHGPLANPTRLAGAETGATR